MTIIKILFVGTGVLALCWIYKTQPEAVISIIGSCIASLLAVIFTYHYNKVKEEYRLHIDSHRKCLWTAVKNLKVIELIPEKANVDLKSIADQLENIEPYLLDRFPLLDGGTRDQLLQYQCLISQIKVCPAIAVEENVLAQFRAAVSNIEGKIHFLEMADEYFLIWFLLPPILKYIKKWIEANENIRG